MEEKAVLESMTMVDDYLKKLMDGIEKAVLHFSKQEEDMGLPLLIQIIDGLDWTIEAVFNLMPLFQNNTFVPGIEQLNSLLRELLNAMENEDFVLISDILQYEILEVLASWHKVIEKINIIN